MVLYAQALMEFGRVIAGNVEVRERRTVPGSAQCLTAEALRERLLCHKPKEFDVLHSNALRAIFLKNEDPFQRALKIMAAMAAKFIEFRAKMTQTIRAADDGPIYPGGVAARKPFASRTSRRRRRLST